MIYLIIILYCAIFVKQLIKSILFFWTTEPLTTDILQVLESRVFWHNLKKMIKQVKRELLTILSFFKWIFMTDKFKNL